MLIRVSLIMVIFLFLYSTLSAQNNVPLTRLVEYEVLTTDLKSNPEPQSLRLRINTGRVMVVDNISIRLAGNKGKLTLLYAEKTGTALWLIQSPKNAARENVLSWNYTDSTGILRVYPFSYSEPYDLILEIQVNLNEKMALDADQQDSVIVETSLPDGVFEATATGRGNIITLNK